MPDLTSFGLAELLPFIAVGFVAQLVDGALGMAFGVISTTLLISLGVPPVAASAGVHTVECFTTGVSGASHMLHRNIDWRLFGKLLIPGVIGGILGAYVLTSIDASVARPVVLAYLGAIGLYLVWRAYHYPPHERDPRVVAPLGLAGGFLDAAGGGGWGPVVSSNLLLQGANPRKVIGTVNTVEFFLTITISVTFISLLLTGDGSALLADDGAPLKSAAERADELHTFTKATLGLLIGGVAAAPLGAFVAKRASAKLLLIMVGIVLTLTSVYGIYRALG